MEVLQVIWFRGVGQALLVDLVQKLRALSGPSVGVRSIGSIAAQS
jgi:hypothetical protein